MINRPTRVIKSSGEIFDHIATNTLIDSHIQSGIIKTDISDHFAVFSLFKTNLELTNVKETIIKRDINEDKIFKKYSKYIQSI